MTVSLAKEIQVGDYPHLDPNSREERQRFSGLACEMKLQNPMWSHFVFKRGNEVLNELYLNLAQETKQ